MANSLSRRQILERMAIASGGAISLAILSACDGDVKVPTETDNITLKALNENQLELVADIADTIIPDTETLGAKSVNVHYLVDELAANWMTADEREGFLMDLTTLDERIKTEKGMSFSELDQTGKAVVMDQLGAEMRAASESTNISGDIANSTGRKHTYRELRELIIFGYYTSEVGASEELNYDPIPGEYNGCIALSDVGGKAWSI